MCVCRTVNTLTEEALGLSLLQTLVGDRNSLRGQDPLTVCSVVSVVGRAIRGPLCWDVDSDAGEGWKILVSLDLIFASGNCRCVLETNDKSGRHHLFSLYLTAMWPVLC